MSSQDPALPTISPQASQAQDPLAQLQDIHVPSEIGLWPPAWGWWACAFVLLAISAALVFFIKRNKSRNAYRNLAINELKRIETKFTQEENSEYLQALSILLRRTALSGFGSYFNASLKGNDWLEWLDKQSPKTNQQFSQGIGRVLLTGPYQKSPKFDRTELHELSLLWIKEHRNQWQQKTVAQKSEAAHV